MAAQHRSTRLDLSDIIEFEAARLAGVVEILDNVGELSGVADSLGVCRDVLAEVNQKISAVAMQLRDGA